jgi:DNA-binding MarR family transcriptional regulator
MADIVLINPRFETSFWGLEHALPFMGKRANMPVAALPLLAALTPSEHRVTIIDENIETIDFARCARAENVTQFSLLRLIRTEKEISVSTLGRYMVMDRTSITRALAPLERDGLINSRTGSDKRTRLVSLTKRGEKLIAGAEPSWYQAQKALMEAIGDERWTALRTVLRHTTHMVRHRTVAAN